MKPVSVLKWIATAGTIVGTGLNNLGFYPLGPIILIISCTMWLIVSIIWKETSMIITNALVVLIGIATLIYHMFPSLW
jgi:hypothetical protein